MHVGDPVSVVSPAAGTAGVPRLRRFVVVGLFDSGMPEYDSGLAYIALADAQRFFDLGDAVTGIEVRCADLYQADITSPRRSPARSASATACATGWRSTTTSSPR